MKFVLETAPTIKNQSIRFRSSYPTSKIYFLITYKNKDFSISTYIESISIAWLNLGVFFPLIWKMIVLYTK